MSAVRIEHTKDGEIKVYVGSVEKVLPQPGQAMILMTEVQFQVHHEYVGKESQA